MNEKSFITSGKRHLFAIDPDLGELYSRDDILHIVKDMEDMEVFKLPYPTVSIEMAWKLEEIFWLGEFDPKIYSDFQSFIFEDVSLDPPNTKYSAIYYRLKSGKVVRSHGFNDKGKKWISWCNEVAMLLVCCLATKGVHRETKVNKLVKLGIGKNKYEYVTTVSIPRNLYRSNEEEDGEERPFIYRRPHIRRGHVRHQWWGPNWSLLKKIWVEPMLVCWHGNEEDFVNERDRYHISKAQHEQI